MRIQSGNGQITVLICFCSSHQGVCGQLLVVGIVDDGTVIQAENKAFAGNDFNHLMNHAVFQIRDLSLLFLLLQRDLNRQISVGSGNLHFNHGCFLVDRGQGEIAALCAVHIAVRRGNFHQVILAQRQQA